VEECGSAGANCGGGVREVRTIARRELRDDLREVRDSAETEGRFGQPEEWSRYNELRLHPLPLSLVPFLWALPPPLGIPLHWYDHGSRPNGSWPNGF